MADTRTIGSLEVSTVGLGTNTFGGLDETASAAVLNAALDAGITFIDTADMYGETKSEEYIGKALGRRRDQVVLGTKFGFPFGDHPGGGRPAYVKACAEESLERLHTEWIDLFIFHRPDPETPIGDTLGAMNELVVSGKVREIGCSNLSLAQLDEAMAAVPDGAAPIVNLQNRFSLFTRQAEADVLPACERAGIGFVPFAPLERGVLTGKYRRGSPTPTGTRIAGMADARRDDLLSDKNLDMVESLVQLCSEHNRTLLELAFGWLLSHQVLSSVIAGAASPEQVKSNVAAGDWRLSPEVLAQIDEIVPAP